jgi:L-ribulose-5-phosphate 3-epimerase
MIKRIGVIQGRLSPSETGSLQSFPSDWSAEFTAAARLGIGHIEFIADRHFNPSNPMWTPTGIEAIRRCSDESGVATLVVCADFALEFSLDSGQFTAQFAHLLEAAQAISVELLVLPLLEASNPHLMKPKKLASLMLKVLSAGSSGGIQIAFETSASVEALGELENEIGKSIPVCFDTGNRFWEGFNAVEDIQHLRNRIVHVHVKDKDRSGRTVALGNGVTPIPGTVLALTRDLDYLGLFTIESTRDGDPILAAKNHLAFFAPLLLEAR